MTQGSKYFHWSTKIGYGWSLRWAGCSNSPDAKVLKGVVILLNQRLFEKFHQWRNRVGLGANLIPINTRWWVESGSKGSNQKWALLRLIAPRIMIVLLSLGWLHKIRPAVKLLEIYYDWWIFWEGCAFSCKLTSANYGLTYVTRNSKEGLRWRQRNPWYLSTLD